MNVSIPSPRPARALLFSQRGPGTETRIVGEARSSSSPRRTAAKDDAVRCSLRENETVVSCEKECLAPART
jgi:hypothetical protein